MLRIPSHIIVVPPFIECPRTILPSNDRRQIPWPHVIPIPRSTSTATTDLNNLILIYLDDYDFPLAMAGHPDPPIMVPLPKSVRRVLRGGSNLVRKRLWTKKPPPPQQAVSAKCSSLWPCSKDKPLELTFGFIKLGDNIIQSNREKKVLSVIGILKMVPGIKFVHVENVSDATIRIAFDHEHPDGKIWSYLGMDVARVSSNKPTMNLSGVSGLGSGEIEEDSDEYGIIFHEFFHTLGMLHEHQHPEREFTIFRKEVVKDTGLSEKDADGNTRKLRRNELGFPVRTHYEHPLTIDYSYPMPRGWTDDGSGFQRNNKPSDVDWAWLNLIYPPHEQKLFEEALSKCGLDLDVECRELILKSYLDGEWERVRSQLTSITNPSSNKSIVGNLKMWCNLMLASLGITSTYSI